MIRIRRPSVVRLVAAIARGGQRRVVVVYVARRTRNSDVRTREGESRVVVVEGRLRP